MQEDEISEIIKSIINEKLTQNRNYILGATKKYQILTKRLEKLILQAMKYIIASIINIILIIFISTPLFSQSICLLYYIF